MILVLSPAKTLDFSTPPPIPDFSQAEFLDESQCLIERLLRLSPPQIAQLMGVSDPLAVLNATRYAEWHLPFTPQNAKQAVFAFNGDVYEGLDAPSLSADDLCFAQQHLRILSGLYGLLRPLDLMQPYRLEMGTRLDTVRGKDLYAFWGERITAALNRALALEPAPTLVNLASVEYFKSVRAGRLKAAVIQPVFEEWKGGKFKIVSFHAKRARGLMARYAVAKRLTAPEGLKDFDVEDYAFAPDASDESRWVFRRRMA